MLDFELSLNNCSQKNITLNTDSLDSLVLIDHHFDLLVCNVMNETINIQNVLDETAKHHNKHIALRLIKNSINYNELLELDFSNFIIKNIQISGRYCTLHLIVATPSDKQIKNNYEILSRYYLLVGRKISK